MCLVVHLDVTTVINLRVEAITLVIVTAEAFTKSAYLLLKINSSLLCYWREAIASKSKDDEMIVRIAA